MSDLFIATKNQGDISQVNLGQGQLVFSRGYNDLQVGPNKDFVLISGVDKLQQDIIKILMTSRGTNTIYPAYGSLIGNSIGTKNIDQQKATIRNSVVEALTILQIINTSNPNLDEQLQSIDVVQVNINNNEITVSVQVTTKNGNVVNATTVS